MNHIMTLMSKSSLWHSVPERSTRIPCQRVFYQSCQHLGSKQHHLGSVQQLHPSLPFLLGILFYLGNSLWSTHRGRWYQPPKTEAKVSGSLSLTGKAGPERLVAGWVGRVQEAHDSCQGPGLDLSSTSLQLFNLSFLICKMERNNTYLREPVGGLNEITHVKKLSQGLASRMNSINGDF